MFAEGIFAGETHVVHPCDEELSSNLRVALFPPRDVPLDIHIKVVKLKYFEVRYASFSGLAFQLIL